MDDLNDLIWVFQLMILVTVSGILVAVKYGFNQVIAGLEAIERQLPEQDSANPPRQSGK